MLRLWINTITKMKSIMSYLRYGMCMLGMFVMMNSVRALVSIPKRVLLVKCSSIVSIPGPY